MKFSLTSFALAVVAFAYTAEARKVYVELHWNGGLSAVSQTIKVMNGPSQVTSIVTSSKGVSSSVASVTDISPVYPTGGYSTWSRRSYYCKARSALNTSDRVMVQGGSFKNWTDMPSADVVVGWNGSQTWGTTSSSTLVFCDASDGDWIYDVNNYKLNYSSSGWSGPYDGKNHYITVSVDTSGCVVEYSSDNASWSTSNIGRSAIGTHTVYYRIKKDSYVVATGSETVDISTGVITYSAYGWNEYYDGVAHGISVSVTAPSSGYTIEYQVGSSWVSASPTYTAVGVYTVNYRISAPGYATVTGSQTVTIKALQDMVYSVSGYDEVYDGLSHGITVSVSVPSSGRTIKYSNKEGGPFYTSSYNSYSDVGTYVVYYQITATGYKTVTGSANVVIREKPIGYDSFGPTYTNIVYIGTQPWYDTSWYTVHYCTNYWGCGYWWVEFRGRGNYTGVYTNWYYITPRSVTITSGTTSKTYDGTPLTYNYAYSSGFVAGEGIETYNVTGSRTDVGISPNDFTFTLKPNTDLNNYSVSVVTGRLTVASVKPDSLKFPVGIEILGTNRVEVGVPKSYQYRITYSDGTRTTSVSSPYPSWSLAPGAPKLYMSGSSQTRTLTAYPSGAGSEHVLSVAYTNSYSTYAMVTNGLVAWYPCDDGYYSSTLTDASQFARNASKSYYYYAYGANDRAETSNRAVRFQGSSSSYAQVTSPDAIATAVNALSISVWVKPENSNYLGLLYRDGQFSLKFEKKGDNADWIFNGTTISTTAPVSLNEWQHLVLTWDGTTVRCYRNGIQVGDNAFAGPLSAGSGNFFFGRASTSDYFRGAVDDLRIFARALEAGEIAIINAGSDVISANSQVVVDASLPITVEPHCRIPVAVDVETPGGTVIGKTAFSFTTGCTAEGGKGWFGQYSTYCSSVEPADAFDYDAAQSGGFSGAGASWLRTSSASGAGTISFWWKADCTPPHDYLVFKDNGTEIARYPGYTNSWVRKTLSLPSSSHVLSWEFVKDGKKSLSSDAAWVDRIEWTRLDVPSVKSGDSHPVDASDGTYDDYVYVTWHEPDSAWPISEYVVKRKVSGAADSTYATIASNLTARAFTDVDVEPGAAYTYKVEARNSAGWGSCGTDDGYRGVFLAIDPASHHFSNVPTAEYVRVTVGSNAFWKTSCPSWLHVAATNGGFVVTADANANSYRRNGQVTVTCGVDGSGNNLPHPKYAYFTVTQSASVDIGFEYPEVDWRTQLQITSTNAVSEYEPVSVFTQDMDLRISFGWRNWSDVDAELPAVKFKVYNSNNGVSLSWTDKGAGVSEGRILSKNAKAACGFWNADNLKTLPPGDYMLEAELDPDDMLDDPYRANNKQIFRFAVRDPMLDFGKDVFFASCWTNIVASNGNDYAQAPHTAMRRIEVVDGDEPYVYDAATVQFGPYVPMDGMNGRLIEKKKPVDIVLLIDYTASMDSCIAGLMNNIGTFIDRLLVGDSARGISPIGDLRIKIVGFGDYLAERDSEYKSWMREYEFTTNRKLLKQQLNELKSQCYGGGGNAGESSYDALYYLCKGWSTEWNGESLPTTKTDTASPFRDTEAAARAVVMFTDEPPHLPLSAPGCAGVDLSGLDAALKEANINLTIIGDGYYYRHYSDYEANIHRLQDLVNLETSPKKRVLKETYPRTLADFTQDTSDLQALAETIVEQVPTRAEPVEPHFSAAVRGVGTVHFRWCNDSEASGTNNTFTFVSEGVTNMTRAANRQWKDESIAFGDDGLHPLKWAYRKLGYEGTWVVDCGLVTDIMWEPERTKLQIVPEMATVDCYGTNEVQTVEDMDDDGNKVVRRAYGATYDVTCNAAWHVTDHSDWINIVQGVGEGDGNLVVTVSNNVSYAQRTGFITVEAGEPGSSAGVTNVTVHVLQNPMGYVENGEIQIVSVGVKPRWPWNDTVDIDFRLVTPAKTGTPVMVSFVAINEEGGDLVANYPTLLAARECKVRNNLTYNGQPVAYDADRKKSYIICQESGLYRVSWVMGKDWKNVSSDLYPDDNAFHSMALSIKVVAECGGKATVELPSDPVRVDMRQTSGSALTHSGGAIMAGVEKIGHPTGDYTEEAGGPTPYDSTDAALFPSNGWNSLDFVELLPAGFSNQYDRVCVVNDADIEGGIITTDTVWSASRIHVVRDNVFVHPNATLTIEEGAIVKFCYATRIFIHRDTSKSDLPEEYNIVVKGAEWCGAFDDSHGNDTIRYAEKTGLHADTGEWNGKGRIYADTTSWIDQNNENGTRAVISIALERFYGYNDGTYADGTTFLNRYYSRGQVWGNIPRPTEQGMTFFGWYVGSPSQYLLESKKLSATKYIGSQKYMISSASCPMADRNGGVINKNQIFALICPEGWADAYGGSLWSAIDAGNGILTLGSTSAVYDGMPHRPEVSSLVVSGKPVEGVFDPDYGAGNYTTTGVYTVSLAFTSGTYVNPPSTEFTVLPRPVDGGTASLSATSVPYVPNWDGGVALPSLVGVTLPATDELPEFVVPASDLAECRTNWYDLVQDATHYWPRPGTYHVEVSFNGNYSGTVTNEFVIEKNSEYYFTSSRFAKDNGKDAAEAAKKDARRILYFAGEYPEDSATAYMKSLIADDIDTNEWVIANFVCWTDCTTNAAFAKYSAGMDAVSCPLVCVLNPDDLETPIVRTCGYQTKDQFMEFLAASLTAPVDASAANIEFRPEKGTFVYNDAVQAPVPGDLRVTYADVELPSCKYDLLLDNDASEDVGVYGVRARIKPDTWVGSYLVTGVTATVGYSIEPQEVWDGMPAAIRAKLGVGLNPPAAAYNGSVQRPAVTSVVAYAYKDYGTDDWFNIGTHTVRVDFDGNYRGSLSETFSITAQVVSATVELDRIEEYVTSAATSSLRPNVLRVYDASRTYTEGTDYTVDYGSGTYTVADTYKITVTFCGNYSGEVSVSFVIKSVEDAADSPEVEGDPGAEVSGDPDSGFVIKPSSENTSVTVVIPSGVSPSKVTVKLAPTVSVVKPNGANVLIARGVYSYDISENLNVTTNSDGSVDLESASVKSEVVQEMFDAAKGAEVKLDSSSPSLSVATREGLLYLFREGETLESLKSDSPKSHVGDGEAWKLPIGIKGGNSGFYRVDVVK